jgi:antitoxin FitA
MPVLHVRNVPEALYERIRLQAQAQNRSISAEVITLLERAVGEPAPSQAEILQNIRRRRAFRPAQAGAPDSAQLLRQDRAR